MDASRYYFYFYFYPNEQRAGKGGGGGGALPDFYFLFFPCSADHERDWPPCKVVFFGLATNALNVRNNNNNDNNNKQSVHDAFVRLESRGGQVYNRREEDVEQEGCEHAPLTKALFHSD